MRSFRTPLSLISLVLFNSYASAVIFPIEVRTNLSTPLSRRDDSSSSAIPLTNTGNAQVETTNWEQEIATHEECLQYIANVTIGGTEVRVCSWHFFRLVIIRLRLPSRLSLIQVARIYGLTFPLPSQPHPVLANRCLCPTPLVLLLGTLLPRLLSLATSLLMTRLSVRSPTYILVFLLTPRLGYSAGYRFELIRY